MLCGTQFLLCGAHKCILAPLDYIVGVVCTTRSNYFAQSSLTAKCLSALLVTLQSFMCPSIALRVRIHPIVLLDCGDLQKDACSSTFLILFFQSYIRSFLLQVFGKGDGHNKTHYTIHSEHRNFCSNTLIPPQ